MGGHVFMHVCCHFRHVQLFATLWTAACQPPLSKRFSRARVGQSRGPRGGARVLGAGAGPVWAGALAGGGSSTQSCLPQDGDVQRHLYLQDVITQVAAEPERPR